jgi:AAA+ superfamily predicted ATPase
LTAVGKVWSRVRAIEKDIDRLAKASEGLDGRRIRKQIFVAIGSDLETAKDPNKLTRVQIESAFKQMRKSLKEMEQ